LIGIIAMISRMKKDLISFANASRNLTNDCLLPRVDIGIPPSPPIFVVLLAFCMLRRADYFMLGSRLSMKRELERLQSTWRRVMLEMLWKTESGTLDRCYISLISQFTSSENTLIKRVFTLKGLWARSAQLSTSFSRPRSVKQAPSFHERRRRYLYSD